MDIMLVGSKIFDGGMNILWHQCLDNTYFFPLSASDVSLRYLTSDLSWPLTSQLQSIHNAIAPYIISNKLKQHPINNTPNYQNSYHHPTSSAAAQTSSEYSDSHSAPRPPNSPSSSNPSVPQPSAPPTKPPHLFDSAPTSAPRVSGPRYSSPDWRGGNSRTAGRARREYRACGGGGRWSGARWWRLGL